MNRLIKWVGAKLKKVTLIFFVVIISGYHYISVLNDKDPLFIAICMGLAIDIGTYEAIRFSIGRTDIDTMQRLGIGALTLGMIGYSINYHYKYYNNLVDATAIVVTIITISVMDHYRLDGKQERVVTSISEAVEREKLVCGHVFEDGSRCQFTSTTRQGIGSHQGRVHK